MPVSGVISTMARSANGSCTPTALRRGGSLNATGVMAMSLMRCGPVGLRGWFTALVTPGFRARRVRVAARRGLQWVGLGFFPDFDCQHWPVCLQQDPLRVASEDELSYLGPPAEANDDQGSIDFVGDVNELVGQVVGVARLPDCGVDAGNLGPAQQFGDLFRRGEGGVHGRSLAR